MRILAALLLVFSLAGCSHFNALTADYSNPITRQTLYNVENAGVIIFAGLNAYRRTCLDGTIHQSCKDVLRRFQTQTRKLPALLTNLRAFVKNNDQVNARITYIAVMQVIADIKAVAKANNVKVQ